jgi:hypothetical protein
MTTTTAEVDNLSCNTPSAYKTGPSPKNVTSAKRIINTACNKIFNTFTPIFVPFILDEIN